MGVIRDVTEIMLNWFPKVKMIIFAEDHAEKLNCKMCGAKYVSRGKYDPGICRNCEQALTEKNSSLIGGPCDGQKAGVSE